MSILIYTMVLLIIKNINNHFTQILDEPLQNVNSICLLGVVINFSSNSIPDEINILCDEIDSSRLKNGKRSKLLEMIINRKTNQLAYEINQKRFINLASNELSQLTFSFTDVNSSLLANIENIYMDIELI